MKTFEQNKALLDKSTKQLSLHVTHKKENDYPNPNKAIYVIINTN